MAEVDGVRGALLNPAALAGGGGTQGEVDWGWGGVPGPQVPAPAPYGLGALLDTYGLGIGFESLRDPGEGSPDRSRTTLAYGTGWGDLLRVGASVRWISGDAPYDGRSLLGGGIQLRLAPWLALGSNWEGLNHPPLEGTPTPVETGLGISLRPFADDLLTLSEDFLLSEGQGALAGVSFAALRLGGGLYLRGDLRTPLGPAARGPTPQPVEGGAGLQVVFGRGRLEGHGAASSIRGGDRTGGASVGFSSARGAEPSFPGRGWLEIDLDEVQGDRSRRAPLGIFGSPAPGVVETLLALDRARRDPEIEGVVLVVRRSRLGLASLGEIRRVLEAVRSGGKRVVAWWEEGGSREYYLASVADEIALPEQADEEVSGLKSRVFFFKETLDLLGVGVDAVQAGRFKGTPESFTRTGLSPDHRENLEAFLAAEEAILLAPEARSRKSTPERLREVVDRGPARATEAVAWGLMDRVASWDAWAPKRRVPLDRYAFEERRRTAWSPRGKVAVLYLSGSIDLGRSWESPWGGEGVSGSDTVVEALDEALQDGSVGSILIRVTSPGGSVLASDEVREAVERAARDKPVVVSMGDVCASGGVYLTAPATRIWASPETLTGSIGVFAAKVNLAGLYRKIGLRVEVLKRGEHADALDPDRPLTPAERERLKQGVDGAYRDFLGVVARGRRLTPETVAKAAEGRIFTGAEARRLGLVDREGGFLEALADAAHAGGVPGGVDPVLVELPRGRGWLSRSAGEARIADFAGGLLGGTPWEPPLGATLREMGPSLDAFWPVLRSTVPRPLALLPFVLLPD